jgi:hypothetical protein
MPVSLISQGRRRRRRRRRKRRKRRRRILRRKERRTNEITWVRNFRNVGVCQPKYTASHPGRPVIFILTAVKTSNLVEIYAYIYI